MGRRYYCDYCDKTFIDDVDARKKHLSSALHQKLRHEHYQSCRDPVTLFQEEIVKQPCRRYMQTGMCQFLSNCKYTHYSPEELWQIKLEMDYMEMEKQQNMNNSNEIPTLESWLEKWNRKRRQNQTQTNDTSSSRTKVTNKTWWSYPEVLEMRPDIPPSMLKLKPEQFYDDRFETWG